MIDGNIGGQTPLGPDGAEALLLPLATRAGLNTAEALSIASAVRWLVSERRDPDRILSEHFVRDLHRRMFAGVWRWAGEYRRSGTNLGTTWFTIPVEVRSLIDDTRVWRDTNMEPDRLAVHFSHRLVSIHPFVNGNGRHSRLAADALARSMGRPTLNWGRSTITTPGATRQRYLDALRLADGGNIEALLAFARS